jgi:hypothetical protein
MAGHNNESTLVLMACGDVGPIHEPIDEYAALVRSTLAQADLRFGHAERIYSDLGQLQVHAGGGHGRVPPRMAELFTDCGFDVMSVATNHAMDYGPEAMLDSLANLRALGIETVGAGANLAEARRPAILERNGFRLAFLAYCSVVREGYAAGKDSPGVAPLRAHTYYRHRNYQPGTPPIVVTIPYEDELQAMRDDIDAASQQADAVVVSVHWGIHNIPKVIADYQLTVARAAFAEGAALVVGHHTHVPKGIEVIDGHVCFYDLSSFIMSSFEGKRKHIQEYGLEYTPENPRLPYGKDATRSLIVRAAFAGSSPPEVSFQPVKINAQLQPEPLHHGDQRFTEAVEYFDWLSSDFKHAFSVSGDDVIVT